MRFRRALGLGVGLALLLPLVAQGDPALAQRSTPPAATTAKATPGRAYVTDLFAGTMTVVDTATNTIVAVVPVGNSPGDAVASPDGTAVYVSLEEDASVAVFDPATNTVTNTIPVGVLPSGIAFTPDGARAYVVGGQSEDVSVIDTATQTVIATIPFPAGSEPIGIAMRPDGAAAYVVEGALDAVAVIDTATNTITGTIPVGQEPIGVAVSPNGSRVYVSNQATNDVSVIDTATNTVVATIPVEGRPRGIAVSPDGSTLYVANTDSGTVSVISTASNTVTATIPGVGSGIIAVATATRVYLAALGELVVIDRATNVVIAEVAIGDPDTFSGFALGVAVIPGDTPPPAATPTITTQASPNNLQGAVVTDTATLSGGANPTGQVIFRLYSDATCLTQVFSSTNPLVGSTAASDNFIPQVGTFYWRAVYTGDANNNPAANPCQAPHESVVISPFAPPAFTRTITGDFTGPLTVNAGDSVQLLNARVVGPVTVNPGGALTVVSSQVSRGIVANSPGFLQICGSQVSPSPAGQALGVFESTVPVLIGNAPSGCPANRFAGNVNLIGNDTLTVASNTVSGNLTVNNGGPGATLIRSNNVLGTLACSGNTPPPMSTRLNQRNTAGARSGQCTGAF
jgi:YVTN family beta-propeller protein